MQSTGPEGKLVQFLDCGEGFLTSDASRIKQEVMPDGLHPNAAGAVVWTECMKPMIEDMLAKPVVIPGG
jgi:lysophospholipase L1-like esterase